MTDYNRTEEAKEVFRKKNSKRKDIKFDVQLNEEQKVGKSVILDNEIVVITGPAGTGKTLLVAQTCLDLLFNKDIDKIYVTRPLVVVGKEVGFLPGELKDKLNPYLDPFKENLIACSGREKIENEMKNGSIEGSAIQFIRGKTYGARKVLVVDEAQNTTKAEMLAIITRLGKGGKIIIVGDISQKDTNEPFDGLAYILKLSNHIKEIDVIKLKENHRSDLVSKILDYEYKQKV